MKGTGRVLQNPGPCLLLRYVPYCFGLLENSVLSFWATHRGCRGPQERQESHQSGLCYHLSCCARDITTRLLFDTHTHTHSGTSCSHRNLLCLSFFSAVLLSVCSVSGLGTLHPSYWVNQFLIYIKYPNIARTSDWLHDKLFKVPKGKKVCGFKRWQADHCFGAAACDGLKLFSSLAESPSCWGNET